MLSTAKAQLRRRLREAIAGMPPAARAEAGESLRTLLATLPCWQEAGTVAAYIALGDEPDLQPLAWIPSKALLLPRVRGDGLAFHRVSGPGDLQDGSFGVVEPRGTCLGAALTTADVILVPGLAFTRGGKRLGRGGGFYDRALAGLPARVKKIGVCFHCRLLEDLPAAGHDVRMDAVLTERGLAGD